MKVLAFDAALGPFSVALDVDGAVSGDRSAGNDALERGLERIASVLAAAGLALRDLDRIAVGIGPGSFTGIRIALSFAKALAYGAGVPLVGISSYDVLTPPGTPEPFLAVVSGRPGVICARLTAAGASTIACGPTGAVLDVLLGALDRADALTVAGAPEDVIAQIGEGWVAVNRLLPCEASPAAAVARLARTREPSASPHAAAPDYGEMPAVTMPKAGTKIVP